MDNGSPRILVIKLRYLGDVLLTTPVFDALRASFPGSFIAVLVNKGTEEMLTGNPAIDKIFTLARDQKFLTDIRKQIQLVMEIRSFNFDTALELTRSDRAAVMAYLSRAKTRLGYKPKREKVFSRSFLFTSLISVGKNRHIIEHHMEMAKALRCSLRPAKPTLYWSPKDEKDCEEILKGYGVSAELPYVVIHPSSNALHKVWTPEGYAAVCDHLSAKKGLQTILVCGKDEEEIRFNRKILDLTEESSPFNLSGKLSLKQLAVLLSNAVLFIGIDSGPMHMATAVDTPVMAIFGPSRPSKWGPWGDGNLIVQKKWDCVPCGKKGCQNNGGESRCLAELAPKEVIPAIDSKLEQIFRQHSS